MPGDPHRKRRAELVRTVKLNRVLSNAVATVWQARLDYERRREEARAEHHEYIQFLRSFDDDPDISGIRLDPAEVTQRIEHDDAISSSRFTPDGLALETRPDQERATRSEPHTAAVPEAPAG